MTKQPPNAPTQPHDTMNTSDHSLTLLTLNAGLLELKIGRLFQTVPTPFIEERTLAMIDALRGSNADLIAFQEIYSLKHKKQFIEELKDLFPHACYGKKQPRFALENGLMFLSRIPIQDGQLHIYRNKTWEERLLASKGFLQCRLRLFDSIEIDIFNTHMTAGGVSHPEGKRANNIRTLQAKELLDAIARIKAKNSIVLGDFNCGPGVDEVSYNTFLREAFINASPQTLNTWDPDNWLNRQGPYHKKKCPPQSIDHVLLSPTLQQHASVQSCKLLYDTPALHVHQLDEPITLSDHYGILVKLHFTNLP